jgi:hypothetical protein
MATRLLRRLLCRRLVLGRAPLLLGMDRAAALAEAVVRKGALRLDSLEQGEVAVAVRSWMLAVNRVIWLGRLI